jgi:hypothetical protein
MSEFVRVWRMFFEVVFWEQMHGFVHNLNEAFLPLECKHW